MENECKKLNFGNIINIIIAYYNNKNHRMLGTSPNEAYKITEQEKIKKINEKINIKRSYLQMNDKFLLNPKFLKIERQTLIYNKVKKGKFNDKIPVKIIRNSSYGYYLLKVEKNYYKNNIINN